MSVGFLGHVGISQETGFGTEATSPGVFAEIFNESISMDNKFIRPQTVNGTRYRKRAIPGPISAQGGITMNLCAEGAVPWFFKGLFGQVSSVLAAEGVYDHTFSPLHGAALPSFTAQVNLATACQNWIGCTIGGGSISISPADVLNFSLDLLAQRPKKCDPATAAYSSVEPFEGIETTFTLNGVSNISFEDFSISFSNDIEPVWTLNGKRYASRHVAKGFEMEGKITLAFDSDEERRRMWGSVSATELLNTIQPGSLKMDVIQSEAFTGEYHRSLTIDIPEIYYSAAPANISGANDRILQSIVFFVNYNPANGKLADVVVRNGESGYPNP